MYCRILWYNQNVHDIMLHILLYFCEYKQVGFKVGSLAFTPAKMSLLTVVLLNSVYVHYTYGCVVYDHCKMSVQKVGLKVGPCN